jgi:hypothetical protein
MNEPKKIVALRQPEPLADEGRMIVTMTAPNCAGLFAMKSKQR